MMASTDEVKDIVLRLRRIEGQVRGLQRMIEQHRSCEDVMTQIMAVRAAINKVGLLALQRHVDECMSGCTKEAQERLRRVLELTLRLSS